MKLAFIDLDGVVCDSTARFAKAEEAKQAFLTAKKNEAQIVEKFTLDREAADIYWKTAFTPELITLDTPTEYVAEHLLAIESAGYYLNFLTSRPESLHDATAAWLHQYSLDGGLLDRRLTFRGLICKAPAFQYTKTVVWKVGMVQQWSRFYDVSTVLFIDDEPINVSSLKSADNGFSLLTASSLTEAVDVLMSNRTEDK